MARSSPSVADLRAGAPRTSVLWAIALAVAGCGGSAAPKVGGEPTRSAPVVFAYGTPEGEEVGSATTRGRVTSVLFVTTFDLTSQIVAKRLDEVVRQHRPRSNALAVALEAPDNAPLVAVFRSTLGLSYPVALSHEPGVQHDGPFGAIDRVPTLVVLDRRGRERFRAVGALSSEQIALALRDAEAR